MKTSIILPTYKEKDNILELIQAVFTVLEPTNIQFEIVVVDDNSPDGTADVIRAYHSHDQRVKLFVRTEERGLATALRYGVDQSDGDILVFMDTDFNHDPAIIPQMVKFLEYYDIIIGSRFVMAGGMEDKFRQFSSSLYNQAIQLLFNTPVHDNLSGFFAIYRDKLTAMDLDQIYYGYGDYFIRLLMIANRRGYKMLEVPVFYRLRLHGHSKTQFLSIFSQYSRALFMLRLKLWTGRMR
ncbi:glycosyltransferase [Anaerolineales bacterium HSG6]|nr:glycosyltransferase [Anaerolineales bacterium HSG6]MDM8530047.1 glycosyltransferase [Anaerolineales bacterium HSG25]